MDRNNGKIEEIIKIMENDFFENFSKIERKNLKTHRINFREISERSLKDWKQTGEINKFKEFIYNDIFSKYLLIHADKILISDIKQELEKLIINHHFSRLFGIDYLLKLIK